MAELHFLWSIIHTLCYHDKYNSTMDCMG